MFILFQPRGVKRARTASPPEDGQVQPVATVPAIPGVGVPASSLPAVADPVGGESTHPELDNEQLGSESAQAGSPVVVRGQEGAGDINNESEGVGAESGGEGSSGAAWVGADSGPPKQRLVDGHGLPCPLPSSPRTLRSRTGKAGVMVQRTLRSGAPKAVVVVASPVAAVAGPSKQSRRAAKKARQVLNRTSSMRCPNSMTDLVVF